MARKEVQVAVGVVRRGRILRELNFAVKSKG